jgi:hypothetical protein
MPRDRKIGASEPYTEPIASICFSVNSRSRSSGPTMLILTFSASIPVAATKAGHSA